MPSINKDNIHRIQVQSSLKFAAVDEVANPPEKHETPNITISSSNKFSLGLIKRSRIENVPIAAKTRKNPKRIAKIFFRIELVLTLIFKHHFFSGLPGVKLPLGSLHQGTIS